MTEFERGLNQGIELAAAWLEAEAKRWVQDSIRKRIEDLADTMRKTAISMRGR